MTEIVLSIIAGLVLFLYAVNNLSNEIQKNAKGKTNKWITKFTTNTFYSIITGTIVTTLLDSSSAVIIITIVLVNSQVLTFRKAMAIVLGANIGTTVSSQIIALDFGKYSPVFLLIGFILALISRLPKVRFTGKILLYFGVLFFGLFTMEKAVEPLKSHPAFVEWLSKTNAPLPGATIGAFVTLIIQSSSATVGIAIILAKKGLLTLNGGIAVMLGSELGTCSDTLFATINGSRAAIKTGLFHLLFNLCSIIIGLILFYPFVELVKLVSISEHLEHQVANAHMLFNISGVVLFVWTLPFFEKMLNAILPEKASV